jgi:hypothetical protein
MAVLNILKVYQQAEHADKAHGMGWYPYANFIARTYASEFGITIEQAAGIISALSPNNKWERNLMDAYYLIQDPGVKVCTFNSNKSKALAILDGANPLDVLRGRKTFNFYMNILDPYNPDFVTIDFHAYNIFKGGRETKSLTPKLYGEVSNAYIETAKELCILPNQLQAITWVTWRTSLQALA